MTVFAAEGAARTFEYGPRDVGYVPFAMGHYILNTGRRDRLHVDERVLAGLHRDERPVVR